ncbi:MAG: PEP-CTERM sorting domain-containing protein [Verrucomicrobia bacterium]|nr:PEP-CTERM sorting domain-containing protein [Verrucomicrobiota bacterium]
MRSAEWRFVCLCIIGCLAVAQAGAATQYMVTELLAPCTYPHPLYADIGGAGHVVGEWCDTGHSRSYIWQGGSWTDLGDLGGGACFAMAINASGQVAGKSHIDYDTVNAFRWEGGVMTPLGTLPGASYEASAGLDINAVGVVAGYSYSASGYVRPCQWIGTTISDLGTLGGTEGIARGLNDQGEIVGNADVAGGVEHAFLYLPVAAYGLSAGINDLGTFGGTSSKALRINNQGQIVGGSVDKSGSWQPWIWELGSITPLGGLGGTYTSPQDLNNSGLVVGGSGTASGDWHAFLWEGGMMCDLNDSIAGGSGWILETACGISDSGWIVGYGTLDGEARCFLLTPVPEPGLFLLMALGAAGLFVKARKV